MLGCTPCEPAACCFRNRISLAVSPAQLPEQQHCRTLVHDRTTLACALPYSFTRSGPTEQHIPRALAQHYEGPSSLSRRLLLAALTAGAASSSIGCTQEALASTGPAEYGVVESRTFDEATTLRHPGFPLPWSPKTLIYPKWLFGEWEVQARLRDARLPLGERFAPQSLVQEVIKPAQAQPGSVSEYRLRFYSTLPDTLANNLKVNLGFLPRDAIIADRAFNFQAVAEAYLGYPAVQSVLYDTRDPMRESMVFTQQGQDGTKLRPRRVELYIKRIDAEPDVSGAGDDLRNQPMEFSTSELYRQARDTDMGVVSAVLAYGMFGLRAQVPAWSGLYQQETLEVRQVNVADFEVATHYTRMPNGRVRARQRVALYLQPQDGLFFEAFGRAVAVYDYDLELQRVPPPEDAFGVAACVTTPKNFTQCL